MTRALPLMLGLAACGPSQEDVQACTSAKGAAAQAWGAYAAALRADAARARERLQAGQGLLELSEQMAAQVTDPALSAELRSKNAAGRAHVEARRALADAQDAAATAATGLQTAWAGRAIDAIRAELAANATLDAVTAAEERLQAAERALPNAGPGAGMMDLEMGRLRMAASLASTPAMTACEKVEAAE